ncbi:PREDICTED: rab3 GTPase-activating protein catalytic subunit-like isoform X2 [Lupinus angustifolius]|uniref:rab3 GTPase-activating protein catalytic subunit-like isoform X2 n=1 Tax=Lupinus angustifolius TaxID=3871 RepID=UPI00092FB542|nr:PREDICTED: rab3 GTPase-activating protein catalytic subunit-like isoform X2 [Lupinus angustifolius]
MASSTTSKIETDDEFTEQEEEDEDEGSLEHFDDFTLASSWERFISEIEAICRLWMSDGPNNLLIKGAVLVEDSNHLYKVKSELKYAMKSYYMEYYFETNPDDGGKPAGWNFDLHDMQLCFGVKEFLVIAPQSASGVVLDAPEASKLLSSVAIALSNCSSLWPAFVPVHDPSRKAYIGIQSMGTVFTRRFEADLIRSQVPVKLMHLEGLYELFVSKFAYSTLDLTVHNFKVRYAMKLTYKTLHFDDDYMKGFDAENNKSDEDLTGEASDMTQWDDDCSWSQWYSAEDPVKGFKLIAIWSEKMVESSMEMAELENTSPHEAEKWLISPCFATNLLEGSKGNRIGFASQLLLLVDALQMSFDAQFMEDFVSAVENPGSDDLKSSMVIPPPTVRDRVLKELFIEGVQFSDFADDGHKTSRSIKGAPLYSLYAQFCLHSLWFGNCNIRAIAMLWIEFVREVRWCWEESQLLPRMPANGSIDLSTCLINQKLQMLAICIEKKGQLNEDYEDCIGSLDHLDSMTEEESVVGDGPFSMQTPSDDVSGKVDSISTADDLLLSGTKKSTVSRKPENVKLFDDKKSSDFTRRGSAGIVNSTMLLKSYQSMHAPYTQEAPLMTEDMHEERLQAVEAFGDSFNFSAQLERDILTSDMSAFKAANPDAVFEDFIRWHSPGDWEEDDDPEGSRSSSSSGLDIEKSKHNWPPQGRLSKRMSEHGNLWRKIWNSAPALPTSEQKPLLDPNREGEKVLHYLETLKPHQLLEQMVCTAFRAASDTLSQTSYGELKQMVAEIEQLYPTMASPLRPLQVNRLSPDSDTIEDLRRLSVDFERVEKLLTVAASLHHKLYRAPRLYREIFSDYYSFYIPKMGTDLTEDDVEKKFDKKLEVRNHEREVLSSMFVPPTANQSWRKVLSMGNLLNGHEPIVREIIFSLRDSVSGNHYAACGGSVSQQEIETYRTYICGTSNDLRVALSVVSCD